MTTTQGAIVASASSGEQLLAMAATPPPPPRNVVPDSERKRKIKLGPSGYSWLAEPENHKYGERRARPPVGAGQVLLPTGH